MSEENFDEHDVGVMSEDVNPPKNQGSDNNSGGGEKRWPGWPGENVFRMLVPAQKVGGIIGRKGESIKKITEETKARIKILDGPHGTSERAVMVSAKEEPDAPISPAMDGLLRVHRRILDVDSDDPSVVANPVSTRLLVADTQAGSLIGKQGATIKTIQDTSGCNVRVLGAEHLPLFALQGDSVVEIQGEPEGVHKAIELILTHLRKFLVDRSIIGVFEMEMQNPNAQANHNMPPHQSWGPPPHHQGFPMNIGDGPGFPPNPQYMPPPRQYDNYYPPPEMPPMDKQPRTPMYGRDPPMGMGLHSSNAQPQQPPVSKVSQNIQIPLSYADAVIGTSGANISYIRRCSGATIAIQETRGVPGEMTVEINGSAVQIQTAQQLIENFMAEAASSTQNRTAGTASQGQGYNAYPAQGTTGQGQGYTPYPAQGTTNQGYNSYPAQGGGHVYASPPPNSAHGGQTGGGGSGDYGPVYGTNYGY